MATDRGTRLIRDDGSEVGIVAIVGTGAGGAQVVGGAGPMASTASQSVVPATNSPSFPTATTNAAVAYNDTTTNLTASQSIFTPARDTGAASGVPSPYGYFTVTVFASQPCTVYVQGSWDNFTTQSPRNGNAGTAVTAGQSVDIKVPATHRYMRAAVANGATAQTQFSLSTAFTAA